MADRSITRLAIRTVALAFSLLALQASAFAQAPDAGHAPGNWPYTFPLWGEKLAQKGLNFPLHFGIGIN